MSISKKSWTGIAREAISGTAATVPTKFLPTKSKFSNKTKYVYLNEDRGTRDGNYDRVPTNQSATGDLSGAFYQDVSPYLLYGFMGADTPSQPSVGTAPTAWLHAFTLADVPPSLTLFKGYDVAAYYWAYCVVSKCKISFSAEGKVLSMDSSVEGQYGIKVVSPPTPVYSSERPLAGYTPTIKLSGTQTMDVETFEIDLDQKITLFFASAGSRQFATAYFGERTAKLSFDARFDSDSLYQKFINDQDDSVDVMFTGKNLGGTVNEEVEFNFPIVGYDDMELDTSKDLVLVKAKATARPGLTANSLFTSNVINTIPSYTS